MAGTHRGLFGWFGVCTRIKLYYKYCYLLTQMRRAGLHSVLRGAWERYKMLLQDRGVDFGTEKQMVQNSSKAVENMCGVKGLIKGSAYSC